MYKLLLFLKKFDDTNIIDHFKKVTLNHLSELSGCTIKAGNVENNVC